MSAFPRVPQAVTTYHYDNGRTGWNYNEPTLNATNVASPQFALRHTVPLDDQVDAQPLVVPGLASVGVKSTNGHDVVYTVTESNTVYAVDAVSGEILAQRNLGTPVPAPFGCPNNGANIGINGTPVIDLGAKTMYLVTYGLEPGEGVATLRTPSAARVEAGSHVPPFPLVPVHRIHALDIATLADRMASVVVTASHSLSNGQLFNFNSRYQRQRAGLLAANGNVYAAFTGFCDMVGSNTRGWVLGWAESTLSPLAHNELTQQLPPAVSNNSYCEKNPDCMLSSIWMSGYGLAADSNGNVYATTGNTFPSSYNATYNLSESVIKLSHDLATVESFFTPNNVNDLDQGDQDLGSGGAMVLPNQDGETPHLVAAAGKAGKLFILNADSLGGFTSGGPDKNVTEQSIGACWCGPSYFMQPSGGVIVASGGVTVTLWGVQTSHGVSLSNLGESWSIFNEGHPHDGGFFTTVSSFGEETGLIIWAVSRDDDIWVLSRDARPGGSNPVDAATVYLHAFSEKRDTSNQLTQLNRLQAGSWDGPNRTESNPNIVPVVANGRVFVASCKRLAIFGLE
jgi:hypothetical protein